MAAVVMQQALERSFENLYCSTQNTTVLPIASSAASEGSCGQEAQRKGKLGPASARLADVSALEAHRVACLPQVPQCVHLRGAPESSQRGEKGEPIRNGPGNLKINYHQ